MDSYYIWNKKTRKKRIEKWNSKQAKKKNFRFKRSETLNRNWLSWLFTMSITMWDWNEKNKWIKQNDNVRQHTKERKKSWRIKCPKDFNDDDEEDDDPWNDVKEKKKNSLTFPFLLYSGNSSFSFTWLMFYIYIHIIFIIIFQTETLLCVCVCVGKTKQQIESIDRSISKQKKNGSTKWNNLAFLPLSPYTPLLAHQFPKIKK